MPRVRVVSGHWPMTFEKRLLWVMSVIVAVAGVAWVFATDHSLGGFRAMLSLVGFASIGLGLAVFNGASRGARGSDSYMLIRRPSLERHERQFRDTKRAYADFNVLAMAGAIALVASAII